MLDTKIQFPSLLKCKIICFGEDISHEDVQHLRRPKLHSRLVLINMKTTWVEPRTFLFCFYCPEEWRSSLSPFELTGPQTAGGPPAETHAASVCVLTDIKLIENVGRVQCCLPSNEKDVFFPIWFGLSVRLGLRSFSFNLACLYLQMRLVGPMCCNTTLMSKS